MRWGTGYMLGSTRFGPFGRNAPDAFGTPAWSTSRCGPTRRAPGRRGGQQRKAGTACRGTPATPICSTRSPPRFHPAGGSDGDRGRARPLIYGFVAGALTVSSGARWRPALSELSVSVPVSVAVPVSSGARWRPTLASRRYRCQRCPTGRPEASGSQGSPAWCRAPSTCRSPSSCPGRSLCRSQSCRDRSGSPVLPGGVRRTGSTSSAATGFVCTASWLRPSPRPRRRRCRCFRTAYRGCRRGQCGGRGEVHRALGAGWRRRAAQRVVDGFLPSTGSVMMPG